jgi:hypothetical protein
VSGLIVGQLDSDLDLIGDECDLFPFDRDNEQAQCEEDLAYALEELDQCLDPTCSLEGDPCTDDIDCCSNKCRGPRESKTRKK